MEEEYVDLSKTEKKVSKKSTKKKGKIKHVTKTKGDIKPEKVVKKTEKLPKIKFKRDIETNIDKLYELIRDKGIIKSSTASKRLKIDSEMIEGWGRVLEDHKLIRMHYPPFGEPVFILKKFKTSKNGDVKEEKKKLKPGKKIFLINIIILACFAVIVAIFTVRMPAIRVSYNQIYLGAIVLIIIIVAIILLKFRKRLKLPRPKVSKRGKKEDKTKGERRDKKTKS